MNIKNKRVDGHIGSNRVILDIDNDIANDIVES